MMIANLKNLREDNDLTIEKIAEILEISKSTYGRWETDEAPIPANHFNTLCNYYQVSMDYLAGLTKIKNSNITNQKLNKELIGKRLRNFRKINKLTQDKLATILNTSHSTISGYETGKNKLKVIFAYDIAKRYNISLDYLYGRCEDIYIKH